MTSQLRRPVRLEGHRVSAPAVEHRPEYLAVSSSLPDQSERRRLPDAAALLLLLAITAFIGWDRLQNDNWLGRTDLLNVWIPNYALLGRELRDVNIPAWSPFQASGLPFAGDPQSGWMYLPVMLFYSVLSPVAATKAIVVFNIALGAVTTYLFARVLGMRLVASLVAASSFAFGANVFQNTYCCTFTSQLSAWLPMGFLGIELAVRGETWRSRAPGILIAVFAISQMMAGWMGQGIYNAGLLLGAWLAYRTLISPPHGSPAWQDRIKMAVLAGGAILVLSLGLSAAGLLPRLDVNRGTQLAGGSYEQIEGSGSNIGWQPRRTVNALLATNDRTASRRYYAGGITLGLAIIALMVARRRFAAPFFAVAAITIPLLATRDNPVLHLFEVLPRYEALNDHASFRWMALFYLMPAMLAGATVDAIIPWFSRRWAVPAALLPAAVVALATRWAEERFPTGDRAFTSTLAVSLVLIVGIAVTYAARRFRWDWTGMILKALPVLLLLMLLWEPTGRQLSEGGLTSMPSPPSRRAGIEVNLANTDPGGAGEFLHQQMAATGEPFRYFGYDAAGHRTQAYVDGSSYPEQRLDPTVQALLVGARASSLEVYDSQGYNPLISRLYVEYLTALNSGVVPEYHDPNVLTSGFDSPLVDLLNVRYIIVPREVPPGRPDLLRLGQLHPTLFQNDRIRVLENENALPHAWITHTVLEVPHADMLAMLDSEQIDVRETTLVEMGESPALRMESVGSEDQIIVTHYGTDSMTFQTHSTGNGMLVVSEVMTPGWNAYVDGEEVPIQAVNYLFRGLPLLAGDHKVDFRYEPVSLRIGLAATATTAVGMLILGVWAVGGDWRRRFGPAAGRSGPSA